jgi:hypothetical protein
VVSESNAEKARADVERLDVGRWTAQPKSSVSRGDRVVSFLPSTTPISVALPLSVCHPEVGHFTSDR